MSTVRLKEKNPTLVTSVTNDKILVLNVFNYLLWDL